MPRRRRLAWFLALAWLTSGPLLAGQPLLVSLPPGLGDATRQGAAAFAELLGRGTGREFAVHVARNSFEYLRDLEQRRYAVVIAGPHVLAALDAHDIAEPAGQFPGRSRFMVITTADNETIYQLSDLSGTTVCTGPTPDLAGLRLVQAIDNPTRDPVLVPVAEPGARVRRLLSGHCLAASIGSRRFLDLDAAEGRERLRIVYQSQALPQAGVAIALWIPEDVRDRASQIIRSDAAGRALQRVAMAFSADPGSLVTARRKALATLAPLLDGYLDTD